MIFSILNIALLVIVIAVMLFIFLSYYTVRDNMQKMKGVIPETVDVKNPITSIVVPMGPKL